MSLTVVSAFGLAILVVIAVIWRIIARQRSIGRRRQRWLDGRE